MLTVVLHENGNETGFVATSDSSGNFSIPGITPGSYEIAVKYVNTLQVVETATLVAGDNTVDFGQMPGGDANDNNVIEIFDFDILVTNYGLAGETP